MKNKGEKKIVGDLFNPDCKIQMFTLNKASNKKQAIKKQAKKTGEKKWRKMYRKRHRKIKLLRTVDFMCVIAYNKLNRRNL